MKRHIISLLAIVLAVGCAFAQGRVVSFENPKLTVYLPPVKQDNAKALIALPGGGYDHLATNHEGHYWAPFYNDLGMVYAVLEYRMPQGDIERPLADVEAAFKILTDSAAVWQLDPANIGIMGSSAGGHLASTVATHQRGVMKPAFQVLFYPVVSLEPEITHAGTRRNSIGADADQALTAKFSAYNNVNAGTPRAIMMLSADDGAVVPENSIRYFQALKAAGVPVAMYIWPTGGHGWGYRSNFKYHGQMLDELRAWLQSF